MSQSLAVELIPILDDNYVPVLIDWDHSNAIVVDPGESQAVSAFLKQHQLSLKAILVTHQHADHIAGIAELKKQFSCVVYGPQLHQSQIPDLDRPLMGDETLQLGSFVFSVLLLPGHTRGHLGYLEQNHHWLFSGDVIFGLGCGRVFDGSLETTFESLQKMKELPLSTTIFCAHEYTESNWRFLLSLKTPLSPAQIAYGENLKESRSKALPSVPLSLASEIQCNPFLLAGTFEEFRKLREKRNQF